VPVSWRFGAPPMGGESKCGVTGTSCRHRTANTRVIAAGRQPMPNKPSMQAEASPAGCAAARHFRCDDVEFDVAEQSAWRDGQPLLLTECEWTLLAALARCGGNALPRQILIALLARTGVAPSGNALNIHLCNLRRKLGKDLIQTIRGRGYRLVAPQAIEASLNGAIDAAAGMQALARAKESRLAGAPTDARHIGGC
jgi:DNA-binding winged helix-turn-helix (wHTH) protein